VAIFLALSVHSFFPNIYDWNMHAIWSDAPLWHVFLSIGVWAGILWSLYVIMLKWLDEKYDLMIFVGTILSLVWVKTLWNITLSDFPVYSWIIGVLSIFGFFFFQILISKGKWMWWGDLRIAIVLGLMLWYSYWHVGLMLTYLVWSIIGIVYIVYQKLIIKNKEYSWQIPFGPFLSIGLFLTLFYKEQIDQILVKYFLL
jgi:leader peptidase (prepilin peptidase)/N-methyltransferase